MKQVINLTTQQFNDWLTALRSGKYKQGDGKLYNEVLDTHCCLGVLCETNGLQKDKPELCELGYRSQDGFSSSLYPDPLVGIYRNPEISGDDFPELMKKYNIPKSAWYVLSLPIINDKFGVSFEDLATIIEESFEPQE